MLLSLAGAIDHNRGVAVADSHGPEEEQLSAILKELGWYALPVLLFLAMILWLNHGEFIYSLDDPYIHLALARQLSLGHYGIQPGEFSAPSSSLLWPLLLTPFSALAMAEWAPLLLNIVFCLVTLHHLQCVMTHVWGRQVGPGLVLLALLLNLYGLVFTGMEHSLQVMLVVWATRLLLEQRQERLLIVLLCVMPWVRYESAAIALPLLVYLAVSGRQRGLAVLATLISLVVLLAFSLFLRHLGLGYLPSSVLAKSTVHDLASLLDNMGSNWLAHLFVPVAVVIVCRHYLRVQPALAVAIAMASALYYALGRNGWLGRYEVFFLTFIFLLSMQPMARWLQIVTGARLLFYGLLFAGPVLAISTLTTPLASRNIHDQQAMMADIARAYGRPVAVNDLGLVVWRSGQPVLDLWGLGSLPALRARLHEPGTAWICRMMQAQGVEVAMVHEALLSDLPRCWTRVGRLVVRGRMATPATPEVGLFATTPEAAARLQMTLSGMVASEPSLADRLSLVSSLSGAAVLR